MHGYGAGRLKPTKNEQENNFRKFPQPISSKRYGLIEVFRGYSSLVLSFLIFGRSEFSRGERRISNFPIILSALCKRVNELY